MSRSAAIAAVEKYFDSGGFLADLARRVAIPTESQNPARAPDLRAYLETEMAESLARIGATSKIFPNPRGTGGPFLIAELIEDPKRPTVLLYGHGDVIRGQDAEWRAGLGPWTVKQDGERIYGRGTADNKGQHTINLAAIEAVLRTRGKLGFNLKVLIETGEETGSPGLKEFCEQNKALLAADALISSDGPRLQPGRPTIYLGTRGALNFIMSVDPGKGAHHSGNWGGLLANPGIILAQAIASITDARGSIRVPEWRPDTLTPSVRAALADLEIDAGPEGPRIDPDWGEPGLTPAERVFGWCSFEVLAFVTGNPERPVNAIPRARARHLPAALRRRHRAARHHPGAAPSSRPPRIPDGETRARARCDLLRHAPRSGLAVGEMDRRLDRAHHGQEAGRPSQPRRLAAQRSLRPHARPADGVDPPLVRRVLPARAQRAPPRAGRTRSAVHHGWRLLGPRRKIEALLR